MKVSLSGRSVFLFFAALCMAFLMTAIPSHAYIDRGSVEIGSPGTSVLSVGDSVSMSISPYEEDHYKGCQMEECPRICGEKDCIVYVNGQMECTCSGTDMVTYYAEVDASSSDPSVATAEYDDQGSVVITAISPGSARISVSAFFREYSSATRTVKITVEEPSNAGDTDSGHSGNGGNDPGTSGNNSSGNDPGASGNNGSGNDPGASGNDGSDKTPGTSEGKTSDGTETTGGNNSEQTHKIILTAPEESHTILSCEKTEAAEGEAVMIRASALEGYRLNGILVTDVQGNRIATKGVGGIYEFTMPASEVKVSADVSEIKPEVKKDFPFTDVAADRWSRASIEFVYNRDLFNGTEATLFSPEMTMTRGMLVTVLYRLDGNPEVLGNSEFTDVAEDAYYARAVKWASDHEIVLGVGDGLFAPNEIITREQLVTIMYRYAKYKGYNTNFTGILQDFSEDNRQISSYAETPFKWAVSRGIVTGVSPTSLAPQGSATREQVAAIVMRFVQKFVN